MIRGVIWCAVSTVEQAKDDKESLRAQEREGRAWMESQGIQILEVLTVSFSRDYFDLNDCNADMKANGYFALQKLINLWSQNPIGFDILWVRDMTRLGRTSSLLTRITEEIIYRGGKIYSQATGMIDEQNGAIQAAFNSVNTTSEMRERRRRNKEGMDRRAKDGGASNVLPSSHRKVYDEKGNEVGIVLNEKMVDFWNEFAELFLEGHSLRQIDEMMSVKYSTLPRFRHNLLNPVFWGHSARYYKNKLGEWAYDEDAPLPYAKTIVVRNAFPSVYTGELADAVKAELSRREHRKGRTSSKTTYKFSGLLVCVRCGNRMNLANSHQRYPYYRCRSRYVRVLNTNCEERRYLPEPVAIEYVTRILERLLEAGSPDELTMVAAGHKQPHKMNAIVKAIKGAENEINKLISLQVDESNPAVIKIYAERISEAAQRLQVLEVELAEVKRQVESISIVNSRTDAFQELREIGLERFWKAEPYKINQVLRKIFGKLAMVVSEGQILGCVVMLHSNGSRRVEQSHEQTFSNDGVTLDPGDTAYIDFSEWHGNGTSLNVGIDKGSVGTIAETVPLTDQK
ncbi:MAG: recombinase zinc beta ribbon domain-containing protein [Chloroflexota bacterium]